MRLESNKSVPNEHQLFANEYSLSWSCRDRSSLRMVIRDERKHQAHLKGMLLFPYLRPYLSMSDDIMVGVAIDTSYGSLGI